MQSLKNAEDSHSIEKSTVKLTRNVTDFSNATKINLHYLATSSTISAKEFSNYFDIPTFLVVEDNLINQKVVGCFLKEMGFNRIDFASTGNEALRYIETMNYSFILLDIDLPDIDRFHVSQLIRKCPQCQNTVIIAITAFNIKDIQKESTISGINHVVSKPLFFTDLQRIIKTYFEYPLYHI